MRSNTTTSAVAGCMLAMSATAAMATPTNYSLIDTIATPVPLTAFDISYVDPVTGFYYFADRSDASVDVINGGNLSYVAQAGGFQGVRATTSVSGPDGVVVARTPGGPVLFGGDGNSTLRAYNVANPASPALISVTSTGGTHRVDEMAYSPSANLLLVANNADTPAFGSLVNATTGLLVAGNIIIPNSPPGAGLEQSVWDPNTGTFFISVPAFNGTNNPGGLAEINTSGVVVATFDFGTMGITACSPAGLALGSSGNLLVGCGTAGSQTILFSPSTGSIVGTIGAISGSDEVWFDPTSDDFFVTGSTSAGRAFDVVSDASQAVLQSIALPNVNAHSIAVDPLNGDVFVPLEASVAGTPDALCPSGCVAVFAVPEPATLPVFVAALIGLVGLAGMRGRSWMTRRGR